MRQAVVAGQRLPIDARELGEVLRVDREAVAVDVPLPVAEELEVGFGNRRAGDCVGQEVQGFVRQRLLHERRVAHPEHDVALVASLELSGQQIGAGLLQRRRHRNAAVEVVWPRLEIERPLRHHAADVVALVFHHQPIADVVDAQLLPVELRRRGLEVVLHILQQLRYADLAGFEAHLPAVAVAIVHRSAHAGRLPQHRLEAPPVAGDLLKVGLPLAARVGIAVDEPLPLDGRPRILPAVFETLRERLERPLRPGGLGPRGNLLVELQIVELVGQLEPLHPRGEAGDRFVFAERVQREDARLVAVAFQPAAPKPTERGQSFHAELAAEKVGQPQLNFRLALGRRFGGLHERPAPALAIALRFVPGARGRIEDRVALLVDRRPRLLEAAAPAFFVVGQLAEVGQRLQPPGARRAFAAQQLVGEVQIELRPVRARQIGGQLRAGLLHELQGANAIAACCVHHASAAAMAAALELPRDQEAAVLHLLIGRGGGGEQTPVVGMDANHFFAQRVDLAHAAEREQAFDRPLQILAHQARFRVGAAGERRERRVGVEEVAVALLLAGRRANVGGRLGLRPTCRAHGNDRQN